MRWRGEEVECRVGLKSSSSLSFAKGGNPFRLENPLQNVTFKPSREKKKKIVFEPLLEIKCTNHNVSQHVEKMKYLFVIILKRNIKKNIQRILI